jgi:hypothetical protein
MAFTPYTNQPVGSAEYGAGQPAVGYDNPQRNVLAQVLMAQARPPGGVGTMNNVSDPLMPSPMSGMGQPGMPQTQPAATGTTAPPLGPMGPVPGPAAPPNLLGMQPGQLPPGMAPNVGPQGMTGGPPRPTAPGGRSY